MTCLQCPINAAVDLIACDGEVWSEPSRTTMNENLKFYLAVQRVLPPHGSQMTLPVVRARPDPLLRTGAERLLRETAPP